MRDPITKPHLGGGPKAAPFTIFPYLIYHGNYTISLGKIPLFSFFPNFRDSLITTLWRILMSIFMIKPVEPAIPNKDDTAVVDTIKQNLNNPAVVEDNKTDLRENPNNTVVTNEPFGLTPKPIEAIEDKKVLINVDGPVGRVFTDVLNKVLATEGYAAMPIEALAGKDVVKQLEATYPGYKIINVHAINEESGKEVSGIINEVGGLKDNEEVVVITESFNQLSNKMKTGVGILISLEKSNNIHVCMSQHSLEYTIRGWLK